MILRVLVVLALVGTALALSACAHSRTLSTSALAAACTAEMPVPPQLRIASYNIKSAGYQGRDRLADLAEVLAGMNADVVALQEVDSNATDQSAWLAKQLGYPYHAFAATIRKNGGDYGIALLSRLPLTSVERVELRSGLAMEPRVAIDAVACLGERPLHLLNIHADFMPLANEDNTRILAGHLKGVLTVNTPVVSGAVQRPGPDPLVVVMGDLNASPRDAAVDNLLKVGLRDVLADHSPPTAFTFPSDRPSRRLDYVLACDALARRAIASEIPSTEASDHRPICTSYDLSPGW